MIKKKNITQPDIISISEIFKEFWKFKILILLISTFLGIVSYFYILNQNKIYKVSITLIDPDSFVFKDYENVLNILPLSNTEIKRERNKIIHHFNKIFQDKLLSYNNFVEFVENYEDANNLRFYLREKKIQSQKSFSSIINSTEDFTNDRKGYNSKLINAYGDLIRNIYTYNFIFEKPLQGEKILTNYIEFSKNRAIEISKKNFIRNINTRIKNLKLHVDIANQLNLKYPMPRSSKSDYEFKYGTEALSNLIKLLEQNLRVLEGELFEYNPYLNDEYNPYLNDIVTSDIVNYKHHPIIYANFVFFFSIFFSLALILLKIIFKDK